MCSEIDRLKKERRLADDFRVLSAGIRLGSENDTQLYFMQQHYKMPTRLLDWTNSPLAALYFASGPKSGNGALYMMDAWKIRGSKGTSRAAVATARSEKLRQAVMRICDDRQNMGGFPDHTFPVRPDHFDKRVGLQKSCFTFHVPECPALTTEHNETLQVSLIPEKNKERIRRELEILGINEFSIFGDLDNLAATLRRAHDCL